MPNKPPRRHHTVPRLYLQRFLPAASQTRALWVTNAESGRQRRGALLNETVQNDFYGPFESVLGHRIDTPQISGLLDKIEAGDAFRFTDDEAATLYLYLGIQATRTSTFRQAADEMLRENFKEQLRTEATTEAAEALQELEEHSALCAYDLRENIGLMLDVASQMAVVLGTMRTIIVRAPAPSFFVTSDCPVAIGPFWNGQDRPRGLLNDTVAFALSPRTALLMSTQVPENRYLDSTSEADHPKVLDVVSKTNGLIARRCRHWLYADRQDAAKQLDLHFPVERFRAVTRRVAPGVVRTWHELTTTV